MQSMVICGRLVRTPEVRYTGTGDNTSSIARFTVAVNRRSKRENEPDADFFPCVAFGKNATFSEKYLKQGSKVVLRGWMKQDNYTNKDGQKVYSWNFNIDEIDFAEGKPSGTSDEKPKKPAKKEEPKTDENGFMDIPDDFADDMPFA